MTTVCDHGECITVTVEFAHNLAGGAQGGYAAECAPLRLDVFGTRELACRTQQILLPDLSTRQVKFQVFVHRNATHPPLAPFRNAGVNVDKCALVKYGNTCARSAALIVNLYATTYTETGQKIWTSLGAALLPLAILRDLAHTDRVHPIFEIVLDRELDTDRQPTSPSVKGRLRVNMVHAPQLALRESVDSDIYHDHVCIDKSNACMRATVQRSQGVFFGPDKYLRPTLPILLPFHVPIDQTDFMLLPSSAYTMMQAREPANVAYYEALLATALRRSALGADEALALARGTRDGTASRAKRAAFGALAVRMLCVFALSQCYMDDVVNLNKPDAPVRADLVCGSEDFKLCRLCGGDDCEGVALEPHMHVNQLCAADPTPMSPLLREVRSYLRTFVPCLALGCVTNKQMTIDDLDQKTSAAHTFAVLIPCRLFERMLSPEQRTLVTKGSRFYTQRRADLDAWRGIDQCPLICEGTAPIDPAMRSLASYYTDDAATGELAAAVAAGRRRFTEEAVKYLKAEGTQNRIGLEISGNMAYGQGAATTERDQSTFYKYIVSLTTNAFLDRLRADFALVYARDDEAQRTFGVRFADFINGSDTVGAWSYLFYTPEETVIVDATLSDMEPIPNLTPAPPTRQASPLNTQAAQRLAALERKKPATALDRTNPPLHRRQAYATARLIDFDEACLRTIETIVNSAAVKGFAVRTHALNAAVDGTTNDNWVLDFYFQF